MVRQQESNGRTKPTVEEGIVERHQDGNTEVVVYEPGNGSRYTILVTKLVRAPALAPLGYALPVALVCLPLWPTTPCTMVSLSGVHPAQLESLSMDEGEPDVVAELLAHLLGIPLLKNMAHPGAGVVTSK